MIKSNQESKKTIKSGFAKSNAANFGSSESEVDPAVTPDSKAEAKVTEPAESGSTPITQKLEDSKSKGEMTTEEIKNTDVSIKDLPVEEDKEPPTPPPELTKEEQKLGKHASKEEKANKKPSVKSEGKKEDAPAHEEKKAKEDSNEDSKEDKQQQTLKDMFDTKGMFCCSVDACG